MARYKKRNDGRYARQFKVGYQPDGRPKYKTIYAKTQVELERKCVDFLALKNKGVLVDDKNLTLEKWADIWLHTYKSNVKPSTFSMYKYTISKHLRAIKDLRLHDIRPEHIRSILNPLHPRTQQKVLLTLRQMLDQAVNNDYIYKNVADGIKAAQFIPKPRRALSDKEIREIFSLKLPEMTRVFIGLLLYCGLRRGEAWALSKGDFDVLNNTVTIRHSVTLTPSLSITSPKTSAGERTIGIPEVLRGILYPYLNSIDIILFQGKRGSIMTDHEFRKMWEDFLTRYNESKGGNNNITAIANDITPHIFRHTYATMLYHAGVDVKTAQYLLGHSTIEMTLKVYTHLEDRDKKNALLKIDAYLSKNILTVF